MAKYWCLCGGRFEAAIRIIDYAPVWVCMTCGKIKEREWKEREHFGVEI